MNKNIELKFKNGEVDIAFGIIEKAYEYRLKNNLFID